ncbi:rhodanese-like domain-containing protein [Henriciella barbarensis]|uniref:Rhodanese-like domain-containing protein n=1 Tax=Henriciella barbarensis TaxID=86342 RepID=A0A399QPC4_9PROT|nr:rhodanese-like domain-containing protein [Henriciella barbarensis]RIJ20331.1 rhodanese-like domain-containing protein [Henriciella barbarensis]
MGVRRNTEFALTALLLFVIAGVSVKADAETSGSPQIDYAGFMQTGGDVMALRSTRLVSLTDFNEMASEPDTIILDARSAEAFAMGHIDGAINVNFADFTDEKLADLIAHRGTRILIYCNNNFTDDIAPVMLKRAPLALNIPTFINLHGYGYTNVYELGELVSTDDPDVNWVSSPQMP